MRKLIMWRRLKPVTINYSTPGVRGTGSQQQVVSQSVLFVDKLLASDDRPCQL